jgi:hypothetical protein
MRKTIDVNDLLRVFTHRKRSWAYTQLRLARVNGRRGPTLVSELAAWFGFGEQDLRGLLGGGFVERS